MRCEIEAGAVQGQVAALAAVAREARAVELHEKELHEVAVALEYAREAYRLDRSNAGKRLYLARLTQQYEQMTKGVTR